MRIFFISDLHLSHPKSRSYEQFLKYLELFQKGDLCILGGDIFDICIGTCGAYKKKYERFLKKISLLNQKGIHVVYIEGNHDFYMKDFLKGLSLKVCACEYVFKWGDKKFYFAHGDLAHPQDYSYILFRWLLRSFLFRMLFKIIPFCWIEKVGQMLSERSFQKQKEKMKQKDFREKVKKVYRNFAVQKFQSGFDFVILGHAHLLDEKEFILEERTCQYWNIGFPKRDGAFFKWGEKENTSLKDLGEEVKFQKQTFDFKDS